MTSRSRSSKPKFKPSIVTVFGSARLTPTDPTYHEAYELGELLADAGYTLCNGGYGGAMEASAHGAKDHGGNTVGIVAEVFEIAANPFIDKTIVVKTHADRLMKLVDLGDAYIGLRGGTGTLLELAMVWENVNKRLITRKPIICIGSFWKPIVHTLKQELVREKRQKSLELITFVNSPRECIKTLNAHFRATARSL